MPPKRKAAPAAEPVPKRMTRARSAKAVEDAAPPPRAMAASAKKLAAQSKVTKITTASARVAAQRKRIEKPSEGQDKISEPMPPASRPRRGGLRAQADEPPAPRKHVQFDDSNKENKPQTQKSSLKATGMRAKPVRKPAVRAKPLSPKKATQVAKGSQDSEPTSPPTCHSPPRRNPSPVREGLHSSPKKAILASPTREHLTTAQLVSPVKSTLLSDSPRKATLSLAPVLLAPSSTPSLLKSPPRRLVSPTRPTVSSSLPMPNDMQVEEGNESMSEDELSTPGHANVAFTPLATQFGLWAASSPGQPRRSRRSRGIFSVGPLGKIAESPPALFEDQMEAMAVDELDEEPSEAIVEAPSVPSSAVLPSPVPSMTEATSAVCTPAKVFKIPQCTQTASRVLAKQSSLHVPRKRSKSVADPESGRLSPAMSRAHPKTLSGVVAHVDVKTSEGADASKVFVELLTQMGARCVKQWSPRRSSGESVTHVVFKDGGKRTLEKARASRVACVGVGWVLDCERRNARLAETPYIVDVSQSGSGRRRSMEPRQYSSPSEEKQAEISPTKEFLTFNTPVARRETFELDVQPVTPAEADRLAHLESPETPYFLQEGAKLVQRTCPPKQHAEGMFEIDSNLALRQRLLDLRRKSLQWASKTQSPLSRIVSDV